MLIDVVMPQLGESVIEGTVVKWLVKPGEAVIKDQPLLEISTDKVDAEIPSPVGGVVSALLAKAGEVVPVKAVIARLETEGQATAAPVPVPAPAPAPDPGPQPVPAPTASPAVPMTAGASGPVTPSAPTSPPSSPSTPTEGWDETHEGMPSWISRKGEAATQIPPVSQPGGSGAADREIGSPATSPAGIAPARLRMTPVVARMAAEHSLDLSKLAGTGIDGRVTKRDVEAFLAAVPVSGASDVLPPATEAPAVAEAAEDQVVPFSPIRKMIAERMVASKRISPHVHAVAEVDMHRVMALRSAGRADGPSLTVLPFVLAAAVRALAEFPTLNAWVVGESLVLKKAVHLGVAVETERGLMVPVVRDAQSLSLEDLSRAVEALADRARQKKIMPDELNGGTFSVSNPGPKGNLFGTPILNQPQVGILRMGQIVKRPVVAEVDGADSIVIRPMMYLVLGYDHRVVDGVTGNGFLHRVREILEQGEFSLSR